MNVYFNRFSSDQHSACSSPASGNADLTHELYPHSRCHISIMSQSTSVMGFNTALSTSPSTSGHTETSSVSPSCLCVSSSQVKRQLERLNQNKALVPDPQLSPGSWRPVQNSYVGFYNTSLTLAWVRRKFNCCGRHPAFFLYLKHLMHLPSVTTGQLP